MAQVKLKPIESTDLPLIQSWRNSPEVMNYCRQYRLLSLEDMYKWWERLTQDKDYNLTNDLFLLTYNKKKIGVGGLVRIDWRNRKGELSFYIGLGSYRNKKIISLCLLSLLAYAHKTLGLHKVSWPVYSFNHLLPIYEKILTKEYTAKSEYYWQGKWWDRVVLVSYGK